MHLGAGNRGSQTKGRTSNICHLIELGWAVSRWQPGGFLSLVTLLLLLLSAFNFVLASQSGRSKSSSPAVAEQA